jgi:hypothetical protein
MADTASGGGPAPSSPDAAPNACPGCGKPLAAEAVLCVNCGFNRETGERLETVSIRFKGHWNNVHLPLWGRLLAFAILLVVLYFGPQLPDLVESALFAFGGQAQAGFDPLRFDLGLDTLWIRLDAAGQSLDVIRYIGLLLQVLGLVLAYGVAPLACAAPFLREVVPPIAGLAVVWGVLFLLLGTFTRITIMRDSSGRPLLIRRRWICFLPGRRVVTNLKDYARIRTNVLPGRSLFTAFMVMLLAGLPGLLYVLLHGLHRNAVSVEIVRGPGGPDVQPVRVYHGASEKTARLIGEALKSVARLQYQ